MFYYWTFESHDDASKNRLAQIKCLTGNQENHIIMELNLKKRTISYIINGFQSENVYQNIDLSAKYHFAVCLYMNKFVVTICDFAFEHVQ